MTYICDNVPDNVTIDEPREWQWTTEPPTQEGWYWVSIQYPYHGRHSHIIYVDKEQTYSAPTDWDSEHREHIDKLGGQNNGVQWLGPLPVPEPPQENESK